MAISQDQAQHFVNRVKSDYLTIMGYVQGLQSVVFLINQETTAWGGGAAITGAVSDEDWDAAYPFTKAEFHDILANFASVADVLGSHGELKTNLVKLRE